MDGTLALAPAADREDGDRLGDAPEVTRCAVVTAACGKSRSPLCLCPAFGHRGGSQPCGRQWKVSPRKLGGPRLQPFPPYRLSVVPLSVSPGRARWPRVGETCVGWWVRTTCAFAAGSSQMLESDGSSAAALDCWAVT